MEQSRDEGTALSDFFNGLVMALTCYKVILSLEGTNLDHVEKATQMVLHDIGGWLKT